MVHVPGTENFAEQYFARVDEFIREDEQVCLIGKSSVFISFLSGWAELKGNTSLEVGE